jgi:hypothetical protein
MKSLLFLACSSLLSAFPSELFDIDGRKVIAEIISQQGQSVLIQTIDGKQHAVPFARFNKETQELIGNRLAEIAKAKALETAKIEAAKPKGMVLTNTIVKQVDGKFRYFFDFRNHDDKPWTGSVEVVLLNKMPGVTNGKEVFKVTSDIDPKLGNFFYMEAHTGPEAVHANASVVGFSYTVINADGSRSHPKTGEISQKSEGF